MNHTKKTNLNSSVYHFVKELPKVKLINDIEKGLIERYDEYKSINNDFNDIQINSIKI